MRILGSISLAFSVAFVIAGGSMNAQISGSGTIQGTVTDASGAVVPQAAVTAVNIATGVETSRLTTGAGLYVLSPLSAGEYNVRAAAPGFQTLTQEHVVVSATTIVGLDLQLKVGSASDQVTVEATVSGLHTEDATLGVAMENRVYDSLPLAMGSGVPRDPTQFIALSPGVAAVVTQSAGPSYTSFNGSRQETNELYLEGVAMTFPNQQGDTRDLALGVSVEAVEQFQVEINGQKAQFQGQGFHNYVLKSGTNQFHGAAYEYFRNTALDARGFFSPFIPLDRQNEFGANIGGPIIRDKVFFFGNYSGYRFNTSTAPIYISVPTQAARGGDFSAFPAVIYDPLTYACAGAICSKNAFSGNLIPANRISSVSKSFESYLPAPTNGALVNNYLSTLPRSIQNNNTTDKVDLNLSAKNRMYGVFVRGKWQTDYTGNLTPTGTSLPLPYTSTPGIVVEVPTIAQIHDTFVISPTLLNNASIGLTRLWIPISSVTADGKYPSKAGLTGLPSYGQAADGFPGVNFSGTNAPNSWAGTGPFNEAENNYTFQDNVLWVRGKHSLTFGYQMQRLQDNNARPTSGTSASFSFSNNVSAGFSPTGTLLTTTGNPYASFLLGGPDSAAITQNYVVWNGARYHDYSTFVQDDWAVMRHVTLNLGLRWDLFGPSMEAFDRMSFMNPNMPNPAAGGRLGALEYAGYGPVNCNCRVPIRTHYHNFEPRVGVAWSPVPKTVVRAGFMVNFSHGAAGIGGNGSAAGSGLTGYNPPTSIGSTVTGLPAFSWDQGVPPVVTPTPILTPGFGAGFTTANPSGAVSVAYINPDLAGKAPYFFNWSLGIQREIPQSITLGATYSASVGHFLASNGDVGIWSNSMIPPFLALGSLLNAQASPANIAAAQAIVPGIGLPFANFQGTIAQMLKPFPQYSGVSYYSGDLGNSTYNSLQVTATRKFANGFTTQLGYTFSKEIDNSPSGGQLGAVGGTRNPYDGKLDRGLGAIDHRHIFHATFVYNLPFGKGHLLGKSLVGRTVLSGWSISGLVTFTSGAPLSITGSGCNTPGISSTCMVSLNPSFTGPVRINGTYGSGNALAPGAISYLNKAAFVDPAPYAFGNVPRSAPYGLFAPALLDEDITLRREIAIRERYKIIISADVFNITNSVYFAAPATNIDSANFGQLTTSANLPRKIQLNARITF